jgi:acetyl esterase/lipase
VALRPADPAWTAPDSALDGVDAGVDLFVACWPILDPLARYRKVLADGNERLVGAHRAYFADAAAMAAGNPQLLVERGQATHRPPMLVLQGTADSNVDHARADRFADAYRTAGGTITVKKYEGMPHTFFGAQPDSEATADGLARIRDFVQARAMA